MAAFWAVFTFGGSGPAITAHGSLDLKQEIQIQIQTFRGEVICLSTQPVIGLVQFCRHVIEEKKDHLKKRELLHCTLLEKKNNF
jgi:hypothetical protein